MRSRFVDVKMGAGHFVKMIHNGIEYGVIQAYAEGFDVLRGAASDALTEGYRYVFNAANMPSFGAVEASSVPGFLI
jgi:6-phosphogluconate dehydrogenase (decarboxylating)